MAPEILHRLHVLQALPNLQLPKPTNLNDAEASRPHSPKHSDENPKLQVVWEEAMKDVGGKGLPHRSCAVLMISWDDELDDLGTTDEVNDLEAVFTNLFNYVVVKRRILAGGPRPQLQVQLFLAEFVAKYDSTGTLLIVYYAGHGVPGKEAGQLAFLGKRTPRQTKAALKRNGVLWNLAEPLIGEADANALVIFDCCYAGNLAEKDNNTKTRGPGRRNFEFLGACHPDRETPMPGPESFTSALIWALRQLVKKGDTFTTLELKTLIVKSAPNFPRNQYPYLCERGDEPCVNRLVLAPLPKLGDSGDKVEFAENSGPPKLVDEYLDLRFFYKGIPDSDEILRLADALKRLIDADEIGAHNVRWLGLRRQARDYAKLWLRKSIRKGSNPLLNPSPTSPSPQVQDVQVPDSSTTGTSLTGEVLEQIENQSLVEEPRKDALDEQDLIDHEISITDTTGSGSIDRVKSQELLSFWQSHLASFPSDRDFLLKFLISLVTLFFIRRIQ